MNQSSSRTAPNGTIINATCHESRLRDVMLLQQTVVRRPLFGFAPGHLRMLGCSWNRGEEVRCEFVVDSNPAYATILDDDLNPAQIVAVYNADSFDGIEFTEQDA